MLMLACISTCRWRSMTGSTFFNILFVVSLGPGALSRASLFTVSHICHSMTWGFICNFLWIFSLRDVCEIHSWQIREECLLECVDFLFVCCSIIKGGYIGCCASACNIFLDLPNGFSISIVYVLFPLACFGSCNFLHILVCFCSPCYFIYFVFSLPIYVSQLIHFPLQAY